MSGDLHIHSNHSDGSCSAERIFQLAKDGGIDCISITDHDQIGEIYNDLSAKYSIAHINGVEVTATDFSTGRNVHILCYLPKETVELKVLCDRISEKRKAAGIAMTKLASKKYPISVEGVLKVASPSNSVFKQHILLAIMETGLETELFGKLFRELFDTETGSCYVDYEQEDVYEVMDIVKRSGGICVLAHPFTYDSIDFLQNIANKNYLDGVEVWSSKSNAEQEKFLLDICNKHGFIPTGGSDFHGANSRKIFPLGIKTTPQSSIEAIYNLSATRNIK